MDWPLAVAHPWSLTPTEAVALQRTLAEQVRCEAPPPLRTLAGLDVSVRGDRVRTAIVVLRLDDFAILDQATWEGPAAFPYISGLLSFREIPAILPALERLTVRPDAFMLDGQGLAHPRRCGLACHLGVLLDWPALGVAKSRLVGTHDEPGAEKGDRAALHHRGERIGTVLRTRTNVKPVYVSVGHRFTLAAAEAMTLRCALRYRLPEPNHYAHRLSKHGTL